VLQIEENRAIAESILYRSMSSEEQCMYVCKFQLEEYDKDIVPNVCMGVSI
jgi:hypothetical protein